MNCGRDSRSFPPAVKAGLFFAFRWGTPETAAAASRGLLTTAFGDLASAAPTMTQKQRQEAFMLAAPANELWRSPPRLILEPTPVRHVKP